MKKEKQIGVRMEAELADRATRKARSEARSLSQVVRLLLESWVKKASKRAA